MPDELAALRKNVDTLETSVTAKLRAVAWRKSREVKAIGSRLAARSQGKRSRLNEGHPHLGDSIVIIENEKEKEFIVRPETPWNPNLGFWVERGTVHNPARPFMRPAGDQVAPSYRSEMEAAAVSAANELAK